MLDVPFSLMYSKTNDQVCCCGSRSDPRESDPRAPESGVGSCSRENHVPQGRPFTSAVCRECGTFADVSRLMQTQGITALAPTLGRTRAVDTAPDDLIRLTPPEASDAEQVLDLEVLGDFLLLRDF